MAVFGINAQNVLSGPLPTQNSGKKRLMQTAKETKKPANFFLLMVGGLYGCGNMKYMKNHRNVPIRF